MSYLDRIAECNNHDLKSYVPFEVADQAVGWIRRDRLDHLDRVASCLQVGADGVAMAPELTTFEARSAAMETVVDGLMVGGEISAWRGERYPVKTAYRAPALLQIERAAVPYFGVHAYGVHLNGFVRRDGELHMWVARRARDKPTYPGMLDNTVAGGQPIDLSIFDNMVKECGEEAGIPPELAATATPVGAITYCHENRSGLKPDCMFCYDLELPADFVPQCTDGEVEAFYLWPMAEVMDKVHDTAEFKFNTNLVLLHFALRHGLLRPDEPDYVAIVKAVHGWGGI